jgi:hypothetical protein
MASHPSPQVNEIKYLSIIFIQLRLTIFGISPLNIQLLKGEMIPVTRRRRQGDSDISHLIALFLASSDENRSYPSMKLFATHLVTKFLSFCNEKHSYPPWELCATLYCSYLRISVFDFFHIQGLHIFASTLSYFRWSARAAETADFSFRRS